VQATVPACDETATESWQSAV